MIASVPRALVVDDDPQMQALVGRALTKVRFICDFAQDGATALRKLGKGTYDVVVTDLRMPNVNGHTLCRSILERPNRPLLVAMTGVSDPRLQRDLEARGVDAIFEKPFDLMSFGSRLRSMIDDRLHLAPAKGFPNRETTAEARASHVERTHRQTIAILIRDLRRASELSAELSSDTVCVFVAETTDSLHRFAQENQADVLVIENAQHGFLNAAEVLIRLQNTPFTPQSIVVGDSSTFTCQQVQSLGIKGVLKADASVPDLIQAVRETLTNACPSRTISPKARGLVKSFQLSCRSPAIFLTLIDFLEMRPEKIPVSQLARIVTAEPATAAELIRFANASSLGTRCPITEVTDSLAYLGPSRAVTLLLSHCVHNIDRGLGRRLPAEMRRWYHVKMIITASVASVFAERYFRLSGETAFVLGLFQDMGIRVLANAFGERYLNVIKHARTLGAVRLHVAERQSFGIDHAEVGAALFEHCGLPETLIDPIHHHHRSGSSIENNNESAYLRPMRIGEAFADLAENQHPSRRELLIKYLADCKSDRCSAVPFQESLDHAARKSIEVATLLRLPVPDEPLLAACHESLSGFAKAHS